MTEPALESLFAQFTDNDRLVRERARMQLVAAGSAALPVLTKGLESDSRQVQWESAKALFSLGDPAAADALARTLEDEDLDVRWICSEALIKLGRPGVAAVLKRLTQTSDNLLHDAADMVLSRFIASMHVILQPVIDAIRSDGPNEAVMVAAGEALGKLTLS